jgi:hypothetical protein
MAGCAERTNMLETSEERRAEEERVQRRIQYREHVTMTGAAFAEAIHALNNTGINVSVKVDISKTCETLQELDDVSSNVMKIDKHPTYVVKGKAKINLTK